MKRERFELTLSEKHRSHVQERAADADTSMAAALRKMIDADIVALARELVGDDIAYLFASSSPAGKLARALRGWNREHPELAGLLDARVKENKE